MADVVVVSGTGTGIGKTWVAAAVARRLRAHGHAVCARKPAQSYAPGDGPTDAEVLGAATGESPERVCPPHRWYETAMAPPMAADALGRPPFTLAELVAEARLPRGAIALVEGAGGPRSPLASDGDTVALAHALYARLVVLVAHPGLGTINDVVLSTDAFGGIPVLVVLNRFDAADDLHVRNRAWLRDRAGLDIVTDADDAAARLAAAHPQEGA
ncbi:MAG TPA: dethiobiotin synthase [Actinomycetota bacterium]|nr:dethiobiotin synthase [Actinomycetota bacterium]